MALSDKVTTSRENIISMIACADDYKHDNQITAAFFWDLLGQSLPDDEIEEFARALASEDGYGPDDYEAAVAQLTEWRERQPKGEA